MDAKLSTVYYKPSTSLPQPDHQLQNSERRDNRQQQSPIKIELPFNDHRNAGESKAEDGEKRNPDEMTPFEAGPLIVRGEVQAVIKIGWEILARLPDGLLDNVKIVQHPFGRMRNTCILLTRFVEVAICGSKKCIQCF